MLGRHIFFFLFFFLSSNLNHNVIPRDNVIIITHLFTLHHNSIVTHISFGRIIPYDPVHLFSPYSSNIDAPSTQYSLKQDLTVLFFIFLFPWPGFTSYEPSVSPSHFPSFLFLLLFSFLSFSFLFHARIIRSL